MQKRVTDLSLFVPRLWHHRHIVNASQWPGPGGNASALQSKPKEECVPWSVHAHHAADEAAETTTLPLPTRKDKGTRHFHATTYSRAPVEGGAAGRPSELEEENKDVTRFGSIRREKAVGEANSTRINTALLPVLDGEEDAVKANPAETTAIRPPTPEEEGVSCSDSDPSWRAAVEVAALQSALMNEGVLWSIPTYSAADEAADTTTAILPALGDKSAHHSHSAFCWRAVVESGATGLLPVPKEE